MKEESLIKVMNFLKSLFKSKKQDIDSFYSILDQNEWKNFIGNDEIKMIKGVIEVSDQWQDPEYDEQGQDQGQEDRVLKEYDDAKCQEYEKMGFRGYKKSLDQKYFSFGYLNSMHKIYRDIEGLRREFIIFKYRCFSHVGFWGYTGLI